MSDDPWEKRMLPLLPELIRALKPSILAPHLLANKVISLTEYHEVKSHPTEAKAAEYLLLNVLVTRLPKQQTFDQFCDVLGKVEEQKGILNLLAPSSQPGGPVSPVASAVPSSSLLVNRSPKEEATQSNSHAERAMKVLIEPGADSTKAGRFRHQATACREDLSKTTPLSNSANTPVMGLVPPGHGQQEPKKQQNPAPPASSTGQGARG
eukprot:m.130863 g.130863  ORF g.130863 m.130863 type:complete len:209 (+) comp38038_c0_seq28:196-822(+)